MDEKERNDLAKQYLPLVKKISTKMFKDSGFDYEEIEGFAWQGFVQAMNEYDPTKSTMSFMSFAAYGIRNAILQGTNETGRTIKISYYKQKQMKERGEEMPKAISINKYFDNEDHLFELGIKDDPEFGNPWELLEKKLEENFPPEWTDMFFSVYGLYGHEIEKSKDIAKRMGISGCLITKRMKKMIKFIQEDRELSETLRDLL